VTRVVRDFSLPALLAVLLCTGPIGAQPAPATPPSRADLLKAAREVMHKAKHCTLVTLGEDGHPQARILDPFDPGDDFTVWLGTNAATRKVREIARDPRVTLLYFDPAGPGFVTILGRAAIVSDRQERTRRWKPEWAAFYKDGPLGDDYVLIRVDPSRLEVVSYAHGLLGDEQTWRPPAVDFHPTTPK
jgi:general stress protein 26